MNFTVDLEVIKISTTFKDKEIFIDLHKNDTIKDFIDKAKKCYDNDKLVCLETLKVISESRKCVFKEINLLESYTSSREKYFEGVLENIKRDFKKDKDILKFALGTSCEESLLYLNGKGLDLNSVTLLCDECTCPAQNKTYCRVCDSREFCGDNCYRDCLLDKQVDIIEYCFINDNLYILEFLFENKLLNLRNYNLYKLYNIGDNDMLDKLFEYKADF